MSSLAKELAEQFSNSAPVFLDPEDDLRNETVAKITSGAIDEEDVVESKSTLRRKSSALLADEDKRYAGRTVTRKSLLASDTDNDSDSEADQSSNGGNDSLDGSLSSEEIDYDLTEDVSGLKYVAVNDDVVYNTGMRDITSNQSDDSIKESGMSGSDDEFSDEDQYDMDLSAFAKGTRLADESAADSSMTHASDASDVESDESEGVTALKVSEPAADVRRGQAVQSQIKLWETLLQLRILLQKLLIASNMLPQHDVWQQLSSDESENSQKLSSETLCGAEESCMKLSSKLLVLQTIMEGEKPANRGMKRSLEEVEECVETQYGVAQKRRREVIRKWDEKTRLSMTAMAKRKHTENTHQSTLNQIDHILSDFNRLQSRSQQNKSNFHIIGKTAKVKNEELQEAEEMSKEGNSKPESDKSDPEIFCDDDFYHQLLRELIEQRTSRSDDPIAMSRQWLEVQALRKKIKRTIDTRASKGRKLRYNVMPKLVNFMAPILSATEWDDDRKDELFASLFDKKPKYRVVEEPSDVVILAS
ncbi:protein AATF-like isoform X2 [Watersipora subatra]|uniref:protein AATF-like isoform X2 n=1 Tax=Watersipora subatra TaxID=2589382 RepID=UPI00355C9B7C